MSDGAPNRDLERRRRQQAEKLEKLYTPVASVAAFGAGVLSFEEGLRGKHPTHYPWYSLDWDVLYYTERALVFFLLLVIAALIATAPAIRRAWGRAIGEILAGRGTTNRDPAQRSAALAAEDDRDQLRP
jgi:hypothetical protein